MSGDPARFLNAFAQALAAMTLYRDGHPARERAVDVAYQHIQDLQADTARPLFTFLGDEVVFGRMPLRELKAWDWGIRLAQAGIQRLEFETLVGREDFEGFLEAEEDLDLAVIVAYEHHIMINGGGYPTLHYARDCHHASKLVHVCDVYDALRTRRPYREAWSFAKTLGYLEERSGLEFDPDLCAAFTRMMRQWEPQVAVVSDARAPVAAAPAATAEQGGV